MENATTELNTDEWMEAAAIAQAFMDALFAQIEHGDEAHRQWVKDEFNKMVPLLADTFVAYGKAH